MPGIVLPVIAAGIGSIAAVYVGIAVEIVIHIDVTLLLPQLAL